MIVRYPTRHRLRTRTRQGMTRYVFVAGGAYVTPPVTASAKRLKTLLGVGQ